MSQYHFENAELLAQGIEDPLPDGFFDLVFSALAVHHLDGEAKRDLFARVAGALRPGGRFVLGDVVVPERSEDTVTPITPEYDLPERVSDLLAWLGDAGLHATLPWQQQDLAVVVGGAGG